MITAFSGRSLGDFFDGAILPWFASSGRAASLSPLPTHVVAPTSDALNHLKQMLHERGVPHFAVRFSLPAEIRLRCAGQGTVKPLADHKVLEAVIAQAAAALMEERGEDSIAAAVARGPVTLAETLVALWGGGWTASEVTGDTMREIARRTEASLAGAGLAWETRLDHELAQQTNQSPLFSAVLAVGFDARHWEQFALLKACAGRSRAFSICLTLPSAVAEQSDFAWIGAFEALAGSITPLEGDADHPLAHIADAIDRDVAAPKSDDVQFHAARSMADQAKLAVAIALREVERGAESVAILVPPRSVVARETALALEQMEIPHFNGVPPSKISLSDPHVWQALLDVQNSASVSDLLQFLKLRPYLPAETFGGRVRDLVRLLERASGDFVFPEIALLGGYLEQSSNERRAAAGKFLLRWPRWADAAPLQSYFQSALDLLDFLGWTPMKNTAVKEFASLAHAGLLVVPRAKACEILSALLRKASPERAPVGNHVFAKIQLVDPSRASSKRWDSSIFAGQNDGYWPPRVQPGGYLSDEDLVALNARVRQLNAAVVVTDEEGATNVANGHSYIVGPFEHRAVQVRDFVRVVEQSNRVHIVAGLEDETAGGTALHPGELYVRAFRTLTGHVLSRERLHEITILSGAIVPPAFLIAPARDVDVAQTVRAWKARRNAAAADFSEFEFNLNGAPDWDLNIPASAWGKVIDRPSDVFFQHILGVTPPRHEHEDMPWNLIGGNWVHDWMEQAAGKTHSAPQGAAWAEGVERTATAYRRTVENLLSSHSREVPTWWLSLWHQSHACAHRFARALGAVAMRHPYVFAEHVFKPTVVRLPSGRALPVGGRCDLVLTEHGPDSANPFRGNPWLIDFKTGSDKPLTPKLLASGHGIQMGLYMLWLKAHGAERTDTTLLKPGRECSIQVSTTDVEAAGHIYEAIARMAESGRFGWHGTVRDPRAGCAFPIATLPASLPKAKFVKAHGF